MDKLVLSAMLLLLIAMPSVYSQGTQEPNHIIVNSQDWTDVYSVMLFGSLTERSTHFLVSDRHSGLILNAIGRPSHIWTINSDTPFVTGFGNFVEGQGYTVEDFTFDSVNFALAEFVDTTRFIIIDGAYGYNAISVAPYAVASRSYVLFANNNNIGEVVGILDDKGATDVLIYGHVDREVLGALEQYSPEIINQDGDRFANNVAIVKKYQEISSSKQAILTNGEFIEAAIMSGKEPVVFIGTSNVPDVTREYIQNSDIRVGVLIGNELVNTATFIRRQVGISVFVKFARSARTPAASISQVEALDMFYLPVYQLDLALESVTYNQATSQLEITFNNRAEQAVYVKGSYTVTDSDGSIQTVGDTNAVFIEGNELKTFVYSIDAIDADAASVDAFVVYGESRNSLEKVIEGVYCLGCENSIGIVDIIDRCDLNVSSVTYVTSREFFRVEVQNPSDVDCYADLQLSDVIIAAERTTVALEDAALLVSGAERGLRIKAILDEDDIIDNPFINVRSFFGQRENALVKVEETRLPLLVDRAVFAGLGVASMALLGAIVVAISLLVWKIYAGKKVR